MEDFAKLSKPTNWGGGGGILVPTPIKQVYGFSINFDSGVKLGWNFFPVKQACITTKNSTQVKSEYPEAKRPIPPV